MNGRCDVGAVREPPLRLSKGAGRSGPLPSQGWSWDAMSVSRLCPQPSFLRRQESIPGARGRPRPIPPSGYPRPRARRRPNRHSCPRAGIHPPFLYICLRPFPFAWFDRLTTNGASLREPPLRLSKGLNGCMLTTNGRPLLSQGWSGVYAAGGQGGVRSGLSWGVRAACPQIFANNSHLTPIHFLTCVVEFPIGYGCFDCPLTKRPFGARCDSALIHAELSI